MSHIRQLQEREEKLQAALQVDRVLSYGQLARYFGVKMNPVIREQHGLFAFDLVAVPIRSDPLFMVVVQCFTRARNLPYFYTNSQIVHLLGVAELRLMVGAHLQDWKSEANLLGRSLLPDALWQTTAGVVAVEFDTGTYHSKTVQNKLAAFGQSYAGVLWGSTSEQRVRKLRARHSGEDREFLVIKWWE